MIGRDGILRRSCRVHHSSWLLALEDAGWFGVLGVELGDLNFLGEAELFHKPDAVVVDVELIPGEAMAAPSLTGWAWWLLCQPSPPVRRATHQELRESSLPPEAAAQPTRWRWRSWTSQVACRPTTTRRKVPQSIIVRPPRTGEAGRREVDADG